MEPISSLLSKLATDFPDINFRASELAYWSAEEKAVYYSDGNQPEDTYQLLHELGHARLEHSSYRQDIELIKMERQAWDEAAKLGKRYGIRLPPGIAQLHLDSYRDWLYARSRCPKCEQAGIQSMSGGNYHCLLCRTVWRANPAKQCGLKRYQTKTSA